MTTEELAIVNFLEGTTDSFVARREIARRAVKRRVFEETPHWIDAPLAALVAQGIVEQNDTGQYRLKRSH